MKSIQMPRIVSAALAGAVLLAAVLTAVLAAYSVSHAAAISPDESRYRPTGPAPGHTPCLAAAPRPATAYAPTNGCVSGLLLDAAIAQPARRNAVMGGEAALQASAQAPKAQHPGARHPEAVLYEIRNGAREILIIDLWCLPTVRKPVGVRPLC